MRAGIFAMIAIVPASVGPLPTPATTIEARVCGGGTTTIPVPARAPMEVPCHTKGCHASCSRKRIDRAQ